MATQYHSTNLNTTGASEERSLLSFRLPIGSTMSGQVWSSLKPDFLRENLAVIKLRNEVSFGIGWYPQWDPAGEFVVVVFAGDDWDNLLQDEVSAKAPAELQGMVDRLLEFWDSRTPTPLAPSENQSVLEGPGERTGG